MESENSKSENIREVSKDFVTTSHIADLIVTIGSGEPQS